MYQETSYITDNSIKKIHRQDIEDLPPLIYDKNKRMYLPNPLLVHTTPYWLTFVEDSTGSNAAVVPANSTLQRNMNNDKTAVIDLRYLTGTATSNQYLINIFDVEYQRYISNRALHANTIVGVSTFPNKNPIPFLLSKTQSLFIYLTNLTASTNTIRLAWQALKYYSDINNKIIPKLSKASQISRLYYYTTDQDVSLTVSTAIQRSAITIISEADFMLYRITSEQTGDFLIRITDSNTGFRFMNGWIHSSCFSGNAQNYYDFEPMLLQRKTILNIEFINLHTATNNVYLTFTGANYYYER